MKPVVMLVRGDFLFLRMCIINGAFSKSFAPAAEALHAFERRKLEICSKSADFVDCVCQFCPAIGWDIA